VPIYTSNSSSRRPKRYWRRTMLLVLILTSMALFFWDAYNDSYSLWKVGTNDSKRLWAEKRISASQLGENGLILVGASRIQLGVDMSSLSKLAEKKIVQLAIDGNPYMSILEDLAADDSIVGTIIISSTVLGLSKDNNLKNRAHQYLSYYHSIVNSFYRFESIEALLSSKLHSYIRSVSNFVTPYKWVVWPSERLVRAGYLTFNSDRSVDADYSLIDQNFIYTKRIKRHLGASEDLSLKLIPRFEDNIAYVNHLVSKIMGRGGRVLFIRFPTSKKIWEIDEARYPKKQYWDVFAKKTIARAVHFKDFDILSGFDLPDGSHLDQRDKITFTENLSEIIF